MTHKQIEDMINSNNRKALYTIIDSFIYNFSWAFPMYREFTLLKLRIASATRKYNEL
jgi:hypothetical protein